MELWVGELMDVMNVREKIRIDIVSMWINHTGQRISVWRTLEDEIAKKM